MNNLLISLIKHPLITGSSVILVGSLLANIFNYFFNLAMGRMLPVADYGLLTSLTSLLVLLTIFNVAFTKIFAKFSARYVVNDEQGKLRHLIITGSKYVLTLSTFYVIILILFTGIIANFLHIDEHILIILVSISVLFGLMGAIPMGVLQGNMRFHMSSLLNILQYSLKFVAGILLVYLGFEVFGAVVAIFISVILSALVGYIVIYKYTKRKEKNGEIDTFRKEFSHYTYTFILTSLGITLLANTDILLVRHFFEETVSGQYAALALMGKAMLYFVMPINFVFFPLIAQKKERNERLFNTVILTSGIVFAISIAISFVYFAFPGLVLRVFFPSPEYQMLRPYLGLFSLYVLIFSMVNIMNSFFLSIGKTKVYIFTLVAAIAQIGLLTVFNESLYQVIGVLFMVNFLLLVGYFVYYMKHGKD